MEIRPFQPSDFDACLSVIDSNNPSCLAADGRAAFAGFISNLSAPYFVADHDGRVVACGGFTIEADGTAVLRWGMVHGDLQRQGIGRLMLMYRLREITRLPAVEWVRADVPAAVAGFFEKQGFRVISSGADRVRVAKRLRVCT